ncbi:hypothetical protein BDP27DRAFT_1429958 [Rhodocollybia butyracea]|uniref:Uncharacterized protein n=1 Tax=Rhodocollybia butyracea TaxID=206335 RepID=A0A9P5TZM8_9AGAR|nr:hypothetical protein BDP27DRAFT_1429958 [Rhodocollybia butyracea]
MAKDTEENPDNLTIDSMGCVNCPACKENINLGAVGWPNYYKRHKDSKKCRKTQEKILQHDTNEMKKKKQVSILSMMKPKPTPIPSALTGPSRVHSLVPVTPSSSHSIQPGMDSAGPYSTATAQVMPSLGLLTRLNDAVDRLPETFSRVNNNSDNVLLSFQCDPSGCDLSEDGWETLDPMLNRLAGYGATPDQVADRIRTGGKLGMKGMVHFVHYFVKERGVHQDLLEHKVEVIVEACKLLYTSGHMSSSPVSVASSIESIAKRSTTPPRKSPGSLKNPITVDIDVPAQTESHWCSGLIISFPAGKSPHSTYPFGLHDKLSLPWSYTVQKNKMAIHSDSCSKIVRQNFAACEECTQLQKNSTFQGILDRIINGVPETAPFSYQGHGGMVVIARRKADQIDVFRLQHQNTARKLKGREGALADHKRFILAIASGKYEESSLSMTKPRKVFTIQKNYQEVDELRAILFWRLGGARTCDIAHRALELPSTSHARSHSIMTPLVPSISLPTLVEMSHNMEACLRSIHSLLVAKGEVIHVVLMFDELSMEKRPQWDVKTNRFLGLCREHCRDTCLTFENEKDLETMVDDVARGEVHLASEATVGAIGILSEKYDEHAQLIQSALDGVNSLKVKIPIRVLSLASDGEARRGKALAEITFKYELSEYSAIYPLLHVLKLMDFHVGMDDITADKDWKHVTIKRLRNLILRDRGIIIDGFHITPNIIKSHLRAAGHTSTHINAAFNPEDEQDVTLAYNLLSDIWSLAPIVPADSHPGVTRGRKAIHLFGRLCFHLIYPYVCVDLDLSEQLTHLSAAAHLALGLYIHGDSGKKFLPNQLFVDIMILVKNAYFCIAKIKIDTPGVCVWLILFGTDRLEILFGILRTCVGSDRNLDIVQLIERLTGTTEVANILALHPEWDRSPRRLKLPLMTRDLKQIPEQIDHIKPRLWKGDLSVANVSFIAVWKGGRRMVESEAPFLVPILDKLDNSPGCNILAPYGQLLVHLPPDSDDIQDLANVIPNLDSEIQLDSAEALVAAPGAVVQTGDGHQTIEDVASVALDKGSIARTVSINGVEINKSRALALAFKYIGSTGSTDRLKRVQEESRYRKSGAWSSVVIDDDNTDAPVLMTNEPVVSLLRCEKQLFLCLGEVNGLRWNSKSVESIPLDRLSEPLAQVSFQVLSLLPATSEDDPSLKYDWCSGIELLHTFKVPGGITQPVNPSLTTSLAMSPAYLFQTTELVALTSSLLEKLTRLDLKGIPNIARTHQFPYQESSGLACFVAENDADSSNSAPSGMYLCPKCVPNIELDMDLGQRLLEHIGAHIIFDSSVIRATEPCGFCLRPTPMCRLYLRKARGHKANLQIDTKKSTCPNLVKIWYGTASVSKKSAPCSNVPLLCELCGGLNAAAVWRYNMKEHLTNVHPTADLSKYEHLWSIHQHEITEMKKKWKNRKDPVLATKGKGKSVVPLTVSEAHSSRMATGTSGNKQTCTDDVSEVSSASDDENPDGWDDEGTKGLGNELSDIEEGHASNTPMEKPNAENFTQVTPQNDKP